MVVFGTWQDYVRRALLSLFVYALQVSTVAQSVTNPLDPWGPPLNLSETLKHVSEHSAGIIEEHSAKSERKLQQSSPLDANPSDPLLTPGFPGFQLTPISNEPLRIALVANGKSVLNEKGKGKLVDQHDLVCRFNYFKTAGYEEYVGSKLDIWFLGELKEPGKRGTRGVLGPRGGTMDLNQKPQKYVIPIVFPTPPRCAKKKQLAHCVPDKGARKYRKATETLLRNAYTRHRIVDKLEFMPLQIEQLLQTKYQYGERWPSSGILALVYILEMYPRATLSVHGFDFAASALGHYWEKIKKKTTVHSMGQEGQFLKRVIATGRVKRL